MWMVEKRFGPAVHDDTECRRCHTQHVRCTALAGKYEGDEKYSWSAICAPCLHELADWLSEGQS